MNKKAFTLVELLAVIAILAFLVILALPNIINLFETSRKKSFLNEALDIYKLANNQYIKDNAKLSGISYYDSDSNSEHNLSIDNGDITYHIEFGQAENMIKFYVTNGIYTIDIESDNIKQTDIVLDEVDEEEHTRPEVPQNPGSEEPSTEPDTPQNPTEPMVEVVPTEINGFCTIKSELGLYYGDVNADGSVNQSDIYAMIGALINASGQAELKNKYSNTDVLKGYVKDLSNDDLRRADLNKDGYLDTRDIMALLDCITDNIPIVGAVFTTQIPGIGILCPSGSDSGGLLGSILSTGTIRGCILEPIFTSLSFVRIPVY